MNWTAGKPQWCTLEPNRLFYWASFSKPICTKYMYWFRFPFLSHTDRHCSECIIRRFEGHALFSLLSLSRETAQTRYRCCRTHSRIHTGHKWGAITTRVSSLYVPIFESPPAFWPAKWAWFAILLLIWQNQTSRFLFVCCGGKWSFVRLDQISIFPQTEKKTLA